MRTGETFIFDDEWNDPDGRVRQIEYELKGNRRVPPHFHPKTAQSFEVLSGILCVQVGRQKLIVRPGEQVSTRPGEVHAQWNESAWPVRMIERYDPPLDIEPFFTALSRAATSRNPLKLALFRSDFRAISERRGLRARLLTSILARVGRLVGLSGWYRRF